MTVLVDSDILIEVARGKNAAVIAEWNELGASDARILYSPVSAAELWAGARPSEHVSLQALFEALECVPVDSETGRVAGDFLQRFRKSHGVELADALIAATAVIASAEIWTRNRRHYPMKDLRFFS